METFERIYKQDDYEQIKEKDGSLRTVRKSVFKKESGSKATMASSMVGNSPAPRFPPIESALTKFPAIADNNNQSLAMVKATPGALATPVSSDVVSFQTDTRPFMQGGTLYLEEITTTTTTTTMTMKRIISQQDAAEHAEQEHFEQEDYGPIVVDSDEGNNRNVQNNTQLFKNEIYTFFLPLSVQKNQPKRSPSLQRNDNTQPKHMPHMKMTLQKVDSADLMFENRNIMLHKAQHRPRQRNRMDRARRSFCIHQQRRLKIKIIQYKVPRSANTK